MGGIIIIIGTIVPVLLLSKFNNIYIILLYSRPMDGYYWFYWRLYKNIQKTKKGLKGGFKVIGQIMLGIVISLTIYFHPDITIKQKMNFRKVQNFKIKLLPRGEIYKNYNSISQG